MGLLSASSPFDDAVEKATDGTKEDDWQKILDICDKAKASRTTSKQCLESIIGRLNNGDPHVVLKAITLLDACVNNSGRSFHLEVASKYFEKNYCEIIGKSRGEVRTQLISVLKSWVEGDLSNDPEFKIIRDLYAELKKEGLCDPAKSEKAKVTQEATEDTFQSDLAKAIELSKKEFSTPENKAGGSSSLYPSTLSLSAMPAGSSAGGSTTSIVPDGRKVRALYDFEAAEDNELTFKTGDIIHIIDDSDPNWWKGSTGRSEGLFPSNFVTENLAAEPELTRSDSKKTVQFDEAVKKISKEEIRIDEDKMDTLLHYLHEADPTDPAGDPPQMRGLAEEVDAMGPLIDTELERVDSRHAQLTQLSMGLVEALNLYHTLMDEPVQPAPSYIQKPPVYSQYPQMNGVGPPGAMSMPYPGLPGMPPSGPTNIPGVFPPPYMHDPTRPLNGVPHQHFVQQHPGVPVGYHQMPPPTSLPPPASLPPYQDLPPHP